MDATEANTAGNADQHSTRTKMSQTWLASHTGPMDCSMSLRWRSPRRTSPATRSQNPPPKSAPPSST